ncbi:MAG: Glucose-repressible alcohol dehydrogenase transcriptional effector [Pycnora praestabilis]|nr:MAG: Glucose-repressible alcohol dehydrogenase transcriptional effector [Pycnora praestabilis]
MADGTFRFQQPGAGQFYYPPHNQQNHHQRQIPRNGSPVNSGRAGYNNDTPSPSRSPVQQSPAHNTYSMYNQGHQQGQHVMMNGAPSHQRYAIQMNLAQKYQHQNHQQQQGQQHHPQQQEQGGHGGTGTGIGHQHNFSSGALSNVTPHFTPSHLQNGTPSNIQGGLSKPLSEHWAQQLQLAAESRQASSPHHYARTSAHNNKGIISNSTPGQRNIGEKEERNRPSNNSEVKRQDWTSLDFGGQGIRAISEALFDYSFLDKLYLNSNKLTHIPAAIGRLTRLNSLDISSNQLSEIPPEIGMLVNLKSLLMFDNSLHSLPSEMGSLFQLDMLGIEGNPLEEELKSEIEHNGTRALITHLRESAPPTLPPSQRDWVVLDDTPAASAGPQPEKFTVLNYNTLCPYYATQSQYGYTPSQALSWDFRKELILQEVQAQNADFVCLQEVDMDSFNEYFRSRLAYDDYKGVFWPKSRARTMAEKEAKLVDGCATFYKGSKFILLDKQLIDFAKIAINRPDMKGEHDVFNRVMPRDHIAVVTFFENRLTGSRIIVANAHIYWDPVYEDVKLIQVAILLDQISKLAEKYARWPPCMDKVAFRLSDHDDEASSDLPEEPAPEPGPSLEYSSGSQIPLLICGDFNSTPGTSGIYELLAHGGIPKTHPDLANRSYGNFTREGVSHPFSLKSAYGNIGELSFTNYTPGFSGVIDYIWYSTNALQATGLLGEVDKEYLQRVPGFPNYHFPSDHLALLTEFMVKSKKERKVVEVDFGPQRERRG